MLSILKSLAQKEIAIAMAPAPCVDCLVLWLAENRRAREALEVSTVECVLPACSSLCSIRGISVILCLLSFLYLSLYPYRNPSLSSTVRHSLSLSFSCTLSPFFCSTISHHSPFSPISHLSSLPLFSSLALIPHPTPTPSALTDPRSSYNVSPFPPPTTTQP